MAIKVKPMVDFSGENKLDTQPRGIKVKSPVNVFGDKPQSKQRNALGELVETPEPGTKEALDELMRRVNRILNPPKDPAIVALEEKIAANQLRINEGETSAAKQKMSTLRARQGRGGLYSLLGSTDRLG
jgi:hypothetical protein